MKSSHQTRLLLAGALTLAAASHALAQVFTAGDLLISRSVYTGTASTVTVGQALPGGGLATADGSFPNVWANEAPDASFGITSPVFLDELTVTGSPVQSLNLTSLAAAQSVNFSTSFPSKSELALNLTSDGTAVTFMGYVAPANTLDVSNSNTPNFSDPSNLVGGSLTFQRGIAQLGSNGSLSVTAVNAYSGNNGRAAVLAGGNYYMVGNAGNSGPVSVKGVNTANGSNVLTTTASTAGLYPGQAISGTGIRANATVLSVTSQTQFTISANATSTNTNKTETAGLTPSAATLDTLSSNTGLQMIAQGSSGNTTVIGAYQGGTAGNASGDQYGFSITQAGFAADKTGKDDNFRGLTNFNNTLYVTKGSGSNGINTVYQVNPNGGGYVSAATGAGLANGTNAAATSINILPGFSATAAKTGKNADGSTGIVYNPFGLWFANATTLYVGDEGDGVLANAATATNSGGLQKWTFDGAKWNLAYTLKNGLGLGTPYSIAGYIPPGGTNPATDGLRNITGEVNGDGTVTIFGVGSTVSSNTDQGADPNRLFSITDFLTGTSLAQAEVVTESFTVLETAGNGEMLRGISFAPTAAAVAIPEPSTYAAIFGLLALGATVGQRRRRTGRLLHV